MKLIEWVSESTSIDSMIYQSRWRGETYYTTCWIDMDSPYPFDAKKYEVFNTIDDVLLHNLIQKLS